MHKKLSKLFLIDKFSFAIIALGSLAWSITMFKSGLVYEFGMGFWGANGHDGVWHIALANLLARGSYEMPTFAGQPLQNYHIGFDLILAFLHKITQIPVHTLYFQILPPIISLSLGFAVYQLIKNTYKSNSTARYTLFLVYFGGSFGWIVNIFRGLPLDAESMFWSQQAISTLINPPFALSLIILTINLISLNKLLQKFTLLNFIFLTLSFALLFQIKIYAGLLSLSGLFVAGTYDLIFNKRKILLSIFIINLLIFIIYLISTNTKSNLLVFQPFWFLETMMGLSDRLGWQRYFSAMHSYRTGNIWPKLIPAYAIAAAIFLLGNLGTRILSLATSLTAFKSIKKINPTEIFIITIIFAGFVVPMLFVQKGTAWNTIQFFYYSLFFSALMSNQLVNLITKIKSENFKKIIYILIFLFTIPTTVATLKYIYLPSRAPARISNSELAALKFLDSQPNGTVLTFPFTNSDFTNPPTPLHKYVSTSYVSAFSNKSVYLEDEINLDITGYDWPARRKEIEDFYKSLDQNYVRSFLKDNNIKYIYWIKGQRATLGETQLGIVRIYENKEVDIYKVEF